MQAPPWLARLDRSDYGASTAAWYYARSFIGISPSYSIALMAVGVFHGPRRLYSTAISWVVNEHTSGIIQPIGKPVRALGRAQRFRAMLGLIGSALALCMQSRSVFFGVSMLACHLTLSTRWIVSARQTAPCQATFIRLHGDPLLPCRDLCNSTASN